MVHGSYCPNCGLSTEQILVTCPRCLQALQHHCGRCGRCPPKGLPAEKNSRAGKE